MHKQKNKQNFQKIVESFRNENSTKLGKRTSRAIDLIEKYGEKNFEAMAHIIKIAIEDENVSDILDKLENYYISNILGEEMTKNLENKILNFLESAPAIQRRLELA